MNYKLLTLALAATATIPSWAQDDASIAGAQVFATHCVACHQAGGVGAPGLAPALAGTLAQRLGTPAGRRYVPGVLVNGLSGRIVSQGQPFVGAMPTQQALSNVELAAVANYVARELNGLTDFSFAPEDFEKARAEHLSHKDLRALREQAAP